MKNDQCPYTARDHLIQKVRDDEMMTMQWCPDCGASRRIIKSQRKGSDFFPSFVFEWELPVMAIDLLTDSYLTDDEKQMALDNKVVAIKMLRKRTGIGLGEAIKKVQFYLLYRKLD